MLGLFAFFYAVLHMLTYVWLDQFFNWHAMLKDIAKRPFITMGSAAFLTLVPLALTSTQGAIRRLGRRWRPLHRLIYFSASAAVIHFVWLVKKDIREPLIYATVLAAVAWLQSSRGSAKGRFHRDAATASTRQGNGKRGFRSWRTVSGRPSKPGQEAAPPVMLTAAYVMSWSRRCSAK